MKVYVNHQSPWGRPGTIFEVEELSSVQEHHVNVGTLTVLEDDEEKEPLFYPDEHTVDEVLAYLEGADYEEQQRVLAVEARGKNRKGIVGGDEG